MAGNGGGVNGGMWLPIGHTLRSKRIRVIIGFKALFGFDILSFVISLVNFKSSEWWNLRRFIFSLWQKFILTRKCVFFSTVT